MSIILDSPLPKTKQFTSSKRAEPKTVSIIIISVALTMAIILLMWAGISYTEGMMNQYSACRDKIVGFEQNGMYTSPEDFKNALSFCDSK